MDLGSLNYTRKLSQYVLDNYRRVERVRTNENRRILFIENKTDARAIDRHYSRSIVTVHEQWYCSNGHIFESQRADSPTTLLTIDRTIPGDRSHCSYEQ